MNKVLIIVLVIISQVGVFSLANAAVAFPVRYNADIKEDKNAKLLQLSNLNSQPFKEPLVFMFFGDVMVERGLDRTACAKGVKYFIGDLMGKGDRNFKNYDLVGANLEGVVAKNGVHSAPQMKYDFAFRPEIVSQFKDFGFNYFAIANNHITDQGESGLRQTRENLDKLGFSYSGCPDRTVGDCSMKIVERKGMKIAMLAFSNIFGRFDEKKITEKIKEAKKQSDLAVVNIHWGAEYQKRFSKSQQNLAHQMIDAGADVIIGHHPHVVQGAEIYKNKLIFYSLGNFIFDQFFSVETQTGLAVRFDISHNKLKAELKPFRGKQAKLRWLNDGEKKIWLDKFIKISDKSVKSVIKDGRMDIIRE